MSCILVALGWACGGVSTLDAEDAAIPVPTSDAAPDTRDAVDASDGAPGRDASRDAAACVKAEVGAACTTSDRACSGVDGCCVGFVMMCDARTQTWQKAGVGCACRQTPCGTKMCAGTQFCRSRAPGARLPDGAVPPDSYECTDFPPECKDDWTCGCLSALPPSTACLSIGSASPPCTMENERPFQRCAGQ